jgi:hypothetical protein
VELIADHGPMNAKLRTDLAQGPAPGIQVGCTVNVHRVTVPSLSPRRPVLDNDRPQTLAGPSIRPSTTDPYVR